MEWLKAREPTATIFDKLISQARENRVTLSISTINLGEIYYNSVAAWGEVRTEEILRNFRTLPITVVHPTEDDTYRAARIKGRYKVAYGDAFATTLAMNLGSPVVSGDPDFLVLRDAGIVDVVWLGR